MSNRKFGDSVAEYFKEFHEQHRKAPSTRQVFKHFSKARFYQAFPKGVAEACELAGIPVPKARIGRTEKAVQASKKKQAAEAAEQANPLEDLKQSHKRERYERSFRKQRSEKLAKQVLMLATDPDDEISGPVLNALGKVLPRILKRKHGITVTVPELVAMQKTYDEATEEGWHVEDVYEWAALSEEEKKAFSELRKKAYDKGLQVNEYVEGLKARGGQLSEESERLSRKVERLKREEENLNRRCSWLNGWLEEDHKHKEKILEEEHLRDKQEFLKFKGELEVMKKDLQNDCKA